MGKKLTFNPLTGKMDYVSVEDLSGYVPYTGASSDVNLGSFALSAGAITGTSFIIGANTLDTNEWAFLDGQNQAVKTTSDVIFNNARFNGYVGIGTAGAPSYALDIQYTAANSVVEGIYGGVTNTSTAQSIYHNAGLNFLIYHAPDRLSANQTVYGMAASEVLANVRSAAGETYNITVNELEGYYPYSFVMTTGVNSTGRLDVTSLYNFRTLNPGLSKGTGATYTPTITNLYGYYCGTLDKATNNYGFYGITAANAIAVDNGGWWFGAARDAKIIFTGTQFQIQSDVVTSTDSLLLRGGTNGVLFNIGSTQYLSLSATALTLASNENLILGGTGYVDSPSYKAGGTSPVADGTYIVGIGSSTNGTITVKGGIITAIQQAT